jgi:glycyl-tRNA synthetase
VTLEYAYSEKENRIVLGLPRDLAPIQVAVFPLVSKNGLPEKAQEVYRLLKRERFDVEYDESGYIGRRYARVDEIGVPLAITIDYETLEDNTVTLRDRDTWRQVRNRIENLPRILREYFVGKLNFDQLGI